LKEYIKIAFADITNYLNFGQREVIVKDDEGNEETRIVNFVDLYEADMVDGSIITEVKQGRDGISVKLADKMKALDKLAQYFELVPDTFKHQIEAERHRMQQEMQKVQIEKIKADTDFAKERAAKLKGQKKDTSLLDALIEGRKQYEQNSD